MVFGETNGDRSGDREKEQDGLILFGRVVSEISVQGKDSGNSNTVL